MKDLPENAGPAIAALKANQSRVYLGARYGLTPHSSIPPEVANRFLDLPGQRKLSAAFCDIAAERERNSGTPGLQEAFAARYSELERAVTRFPQELRLLKPFSLGKLLVTGSYSSEIVNCFDNLSLAVEDLGVSNIRVDAAPTNTFLIMLHGWFGNPTSGLLTRDAVEGFEEERQRLAPLVKSLLREKPWVILGCQSQDDVTFLRLCRDVSKKLGVRQRPIFVVDPGETEELYPHWHREPLRHVRMSVEEFLLAAANSQGASSPRPPDQGLPPPDFVPDPDEDPSAPVIEERDPNKGNGDEPNEPPPDAPRRVLIETLDGRAFQTQAPGNLRIANLASQFVRRYLHGEQSSTRRERAVVDLQTPEGWARCNGNANLAEAGIRDGDRLRVYTDSVAAAYDPRRREAYLADVQHQLEDLARQDPRFSVKPNLPLASDRYEIVLRCHGWAPPEPPAFAPRPTDEQKFVLLYPAEAPGVAPWVHCEKPSFHPNIDAKTGYVCLGALKESWTPLFGPQELVRMLIEVSEYRNFELDGVLNREAAIWAQLNPDTIAEHGGWPYQPTLADRSTSRGEIQLIFEPQPTGVGLKRRRKS